MAYSPRPEITSPRSGKRDNRVAISNQYFGAFRDGSLKYRGIELRRHDSTNWVKEVQLEVLEVLAEAGSPDQLPSYVPKALSVATRAKQDLKHGRVDHRELVVCQKVTRAVEEYKSPSPAARGYAASGTWPENRTRPGG